MKVRIKSMYFVCMWLEKRPERATYSNNELVTNVKPILEIGVDDRVSFKIYYIGFCRLVLAFWFAPRKSIHDQEYASDYLIKIGVIPFDLYKRKRFKNGSFSSNMGDKPFG